MEFNKKQTPYLSGIASIGCSSLPSVVIVKCCSVGMSTMVGIASADQKKDLISALGRAGVKACDAARNLSDAFAGINDPNKGLRIELRLADAQSVNELLMLNKIEPEKQSYKQSQADKWANKYNYKIER